MTKKKSKKSQKTAQQPAPAAEPGKMGDDIDMLEDIKRDEDLYISESDVTNISNFIRTTNKSFNSLGNKVVEMFNGRCSLGFLYALVSLFDQESEEREDVIRRLNIIYIVWRLPDLESELKIKPQRNMNDVYSHPYATFLFYVERLEKFKIESTLARIIVTNNVGVVEKLTAPDFIQKAAKLDVYKVEPDGFEKYELANSAHWPEITEESVSLSKAMRELGTFRERKDHEAGMAEAFYPLMHVAPTMLPPRMQPLESENPAMAEYCIRDIETEDYKDRKEEIIYTLNPKEDEIKDDLLKAFQDLKPSVDDYQNSINTAMTETEKEEADREIELGEAWIESSASDVGTDDYLSDEEKAEADFRAMTAASPDLNDKTIDFCVERILDGTPLTTIRTESLTAFAMTCSFSHPQYVRLLEATETDDNVIEMIKTNQRFAKEFLYRNAVSEQQTCLLFKRYIRICYDITPVVQGLEIVLKLAKEFKSLQRIGPEHKVALMGYLRHLIGKSEDEEDKGGNIRSSRLIAVLIRKLLKEQIFHVDELQEIATEMKSYALRHTGCRECTLLYQEISGLQSGDLKPSQIGDHAVNSVTTTTTTVKDGNTTTTTVVQQVKHGNQTVQSTVTQTNSSKSINAIRKQAQALLRPPSSKSSSSSASPGAKSGSPKPSKDQNPPQGS